MAQKIMDIMNELKENESFQYVVETLHLFFNIQQQPGSDIEEKILLLQNKYEEIASVNQQMTTEEFLKELVALKERLENQEQNQQEFTSWREEHTNTITGINEVLEKLQQENTTALKEEIEKLQHKHTTFTEESENRLKSMKEEVEKLQEENNTALKEEIEKLQHAYTSFREESENSIKSMMEEIEQLRKDTTLDEDSEDEDECRPLSPEELAFNASMKEDIKKLSKETSQLKRDFKEFKNCKQSLDNLISTLTQEKQVHLEHMKQHTHHLSELKSTDKEHQIQLDDLKSLLEDQSLAILQSSQESNATPPRSVESPSNQDSKIGDIHYHTLEYSVEDGKVIWKTKEASVQSDGSWPDQTKV